MFSIYYSFSIFTRLCLP